MPKQQWSHERLVVVILDAENQTQTTTLGETSTDNILGSDFGGYLHEDTWTTPNCSRWAITSPYVFNVVSFAGLLNSLKQPFRTNVNIINQYRERYHENQSCPRQVTVPVGVQLRGGRETKEDPTRKKLQAFDSRNPGVSWVRGHHCHLIMDTCQYYWHLVAGWRWVVHGAKSGSQARGLIPLVSLCSIKKR